MITKIDRELAEQIVNTIKDVCDRDINFIAPSGIILASTDSSRVGTFHEIGQQAAASGSVLEVTEDNNFPAQNRESIFRFIIMNICWPSSESPVYLIKSPGMLISRTHHHPSSGSGEKNQYGRPPADKKHFVIQSLIRNETDNQEYLTSCLHEFKIDLNTKKKNCSYSHK